MCSCDLCFGILDHIGFFLCSILFVYKDLVSSAFHVSPLTPVHQPDHKSTAWEGSLLPGQQAPSPKPGTLTFYHCPPQLQLPIYSSLGNFIKCTSSAPLITTSSFQLDNLASWSQLWNQFCNMAYITCLILFCHISRTLLTKLWWNYWTRLNSILPFLVPLTSSA